MARLRNQFVPIDPRVWDANMDVLVNVALGAGTNEDKMAFLGQVAAKQELIMQQGGIYDNPLVDLAQYRNTLAQMLALAGFKDPNMFFKDPALQPPPQPQPPQPSPEQILAQVQAQAIQADIQKKAAELELQREEMMRKDDREKDKIESDAFIRMAEIEARYNTQVDAAAVNAAMQRDREAIRQQGEMNRAAVNAAMQAATQPAPMQPAAPTMTPPMQGPMNG
jgi:hypothetical protein